MAERELLFWSHVDRSGGPDACWPWMLARNADGYGCASWARRTRLAHRVAYTLVIGPPGPVLRHSCDNPPCCNPAHLSPGTQAENLAEMAARGRAHRPQGERHSRARLSPDQVDEVRIADLTRYGSAVALARRLGVTTRTIYQIRSGERWAHTMGGQ